MSLVYLGAGEGLGTRYITFRVKSIDVDKLKQKLGGSVGTVAKASIPLIDSMPDIAIRGAMPFVLSQARDFGVDVDWQVGKAPPIEGHPAPDQFGVGIAAGVAASVVGWLAWRYGIKKFL